MSGDFSGVSERVGGCVTSQVPVWSRSSFPSGRENDVSSGKSYGGSRSLEGSGR